MQTLRIYDFVIYQGLLDHAAQVALRDEVRAAVQHAPLIRQKTPLGAPMSVRTTSAGLFGWVSGRSGYRYSATQRNGVPWPDMPQGALSVWGKISDCSKSPECCLINYYDASARMGLHQDKDEACFDYPVVSISLGDDALFRMGQATRGGQTRSVWLKSGDVLVMSGTARMSYHGIDRIRFGSSRLLKNNGRINLTLRVVT